jgi:hypothetical protein
LSTFDPGRERRLWRCDERRRGKWRRWRWRGQQQGVPFQIGFEFTLDGSHVQSARFGFALLDEKASVAIRRLAAALPVRLRR